MTKVEQLKIQPDTVAKIVIDGATGSFDKEYSYAVPDRKSVV